VGNIKFIRARRKKDDKENIVDDFEAFQGKGQSLRQSKKKWRYALTLSTILFNVY
jgi:hypothetical protein